MKLVNRQSFIMLFMVIAGFSSQTRCSDNNNQISLTPQEIIYADATSQDEDDVLNNAVIHDEDEIADIRAAINDDSEEEDEEYNGSKISSIHSSDDEEEYFDGLPRQ